MVGLYAAFAVGTHLVPTVSLNVCYTPIENVDEQVYELLSGSLKANQVLDNVPPMFANNIKNETLYIHDDVCAKWRWVAESLRATMRMTLGFVAGLMTFALMIWLPSLLLGSKHPEK